MGGRNSKIPVPFPGQILKLTGLEEYDDLYKKLEKIVQKIDYARTELDLRFTDFIRSLGTSKLWERCPNFKEMIRILIVVLITNGKGSLANIHLYVNKPPYLEFDRKNYSYYMKVLINDFNLYINTVIQLTNLLNPIKEKIESMSLQSQIEDSLGKVSQCAINNDYSVKDMIKVIKISQENKEIIVKAFISLEKMLELPSIVKKSIAKVFYESQRSPTFDKIIQQAAQAQYEELSTPESIVQHFWPYPA